MAILPQTKKTKVEASFRSSLRRHVLRKRRRSLAGRQCCVPRMPLRWRDAERIEQPTHGVAPVALGTGHRHMTLIADTPVRFIEQRRRKRFPRHAPIIKLSGCASAGQRPCETRRRAGTLRCRRESARRIGARRPWSTPRSRPLSTVDPIPSASISSSIARPSISAATMMSWPA